MALLTDAKARKIDAGGKALAGGGVPGLYLFPTAESGRGKWILRFVSPVTKKRRDMGLGRYPEVSIRDARDAALAARLVIRKGADPIKLRRVEEAAAQVEAVRVPTFETAARTVFAEVSRSFRNAKHKQQWIHTLEDFVFPRIGSLPVDELRAAQFADVLKPIWLSKPETASRVRQRCDAVMKWCAAQGFIVASPVGVVGQLLAKQPGKRERVEHHPAIPWRDIPNFVASELSGKPATAGRRMLELLILTAARSGEIRGMRWEELDLEQAIWTIPGSRMKARAAHRVPLSPRCVELIREIKGDAKRSGLVFTSRNGTPLSDMTLTKLLRDAKAPSDAPGRVATAHGFRSSFRDWASENGYQRDMAERALAHTISNSTEAAYHRTDLLDQRRAMMEAWQRHCIRS